MNKLPNDFQITDDHRQYCAEKWGHPMLPDTFIEAFVEYWTDGEGAGERKKNWDRAFTNWIRRVSPLETRRTDNWEVHLEQAKRLENRTRARKTPEYHVLEIEQIPCTPQVGELARKRLRELLA